MGRCRNLGSWKSFLWYAPQLSGASILCFVILCSLWGHYWGFLQFDCGWEGLRAGGGGATEDEMVVWHHQLNGYEFEQTLGDREGQETLACCSPWGHNESDMTERLDSNNILQGFFFFVFVCFLPVFPKDSPVHSLRWRWLQSLMTLIYLVYWYGKQYFISQLWKYSSREKYFIIVSVKETIPLTFGHWNVLCRWYVFAFRIPSVCRARAYIWMYCCLVIKLCLTLLWRHAC